jgi:hypothetical protein
MPKGVGYGKGAMKKKTTSKVGMRKKTTATGGMKKKMGGGKKVAMKKASRTSKSPMKKKYA